MIAWPLSRFVCISTASRCMHSCTKDCSVSTVLSPEVRSDPSIWSEADRNRTSMIIVGMWIGTMPPLAIWRYQGRKEMPFRSQAPRPGHRHDRGHQIGTGRADHRSRRGQREDHRVHRRIADIQIGEIQIMSCMGNNGNQQLLCTCST